jgi:REP element-mobilizing transposase RayT
VTARGTERRDIVRDERDREHYLELVGELPGRFGVLLHAHVLMRKHFHRLLETPEANLSRSAQWLNASYRVR